MGRRENPLDPAAGGTEGFAAVLRAARVKAGQPTYRQLARKCHFSAATLARAASGRSLPSLEVALAYAVACDANEADLADLRLRWEAARLEMSSTSSAADPVSDPDGLPGPSQEAPEAEPGLPAEPSEATGTDVPRLTRVIGRVLTKRAAIGVVLCVSLALNGILLARSSIEPGGRQPRPPSAAEPSPSSAAAAVPDATDPKAYGCGADATDLDQVSVTLPQPATIAGHLRPAGTVLGTVSLRYSATCAGAWSRFDPAGGIFSQPAQGTVDTRTLRTSDGTYVEFHLGHIDQSYADLLLTGLGCIEARATVHVANDTITATATTKCLPKI